MIVRRRWWLPLIATVVAAAASLLTSPLSQGSYTASLRVLLGVEPDTGSGSYFRYDRYYSMLSTEFLTDDFIEVVRSRVFHDAVAQEMGTPSVGAFSVTAPARSERAPRIVTITVTSAGEEEARRAAEAAARVATNQLTRFFPQLPPGSLVANVIDPPAVTPPTAGGRNYLNIALRTAVGLLAGLGLALLLHYLDDRLYEPAEVEQLLGLPVLAQIPKRRKGR